MMSLTKLLLTLRLVPSFHDYIKCASGTSCQFGHKIYIDDGGSVDFFEAIPRQYIQK